jgi:myo-inositol 2-dehydrogenase / D-chiro-inositol 1-dehydrogenase
MNIALIGFGAWGQHHATAIQETADLALAGICTRSEESRAAAAKLGVPVTADYRELLATPGLDAVDIVLPTRLHHEVASAALAAGLNVLLEKPMAATVEECEDLQAQADDAQKVLLVGHEFRLSTQWGRMRRLIAEGAVGEVQACTIDLWRRPYRQGSAGWRHDPEQVVSWVLEEPIHFFDLATWWLKECGAPEWVYARGTRLPSTKAGLYDNLTAVVEFETGAHATVTQSLSAAEHHLTAKVMGTKGALIATWDGEMDRTTAPRASLKLYDGERIGEIEIEASGEFFELRTELAHFAALCKGETDPIITPAEAARAVAICWAAERSIRSGEAERL